jgi:Cu+-exporting ATPase
MVKVSKIQTLEVSISGMDCAECTQHVQTAISKLPGVESVNVLLGSEKAIVRLDPSQVELAAIRDAVQSAGYSVPEEAAAPPVAPFGNFTRRIVTLLAVLFGVILFIIVAGEWLGLLEQITERVPFLIGLLLVAIAGWPIFRNVIRATLHKQVISHTLMTLGVLAALAIGQWATALVVVFFMRIGDYVESFTAEGARRAVKDLTALNPQTARIERDGEEREVAITEVRRGEVVIVRPGERIPVDGEVLEGQATMDQSVITGESMPVEVAPGSQVFAASLAQLGSLRIRTVRVGADTTFGRVVKMVEEAEANRAEVQRFADKFSAYFLPIVAGTAALTFLFSRNPLSTAAVLVVACSCSVALATPIAMLASIGGSAKRGLLIKGGKYLELLARADVILIDKTGTLTLGKPQVSDIISLNGLEKSEILQLAASAERYSEHPLAEAVRAAAHERHIAMLNPKDFVAIPGKGIRATVDDQRLAIGNLQMVPEAASLPATLDLEGQGKSLLFLVRDEELIGVIAAADTLRPEVPEALAELRQLGLHQIELLTGDNERTAATLAQKIGVSFQANLLPEDKIAIVKEYQSQGHVVVMVGDGVNDAPALAQADVGIAMGAAGTDIAMEAAHIALMREDWLLVPEVLRIARRTMGVVKMNLGFTAIYNIAGLALAAFGFLPPIFAAAAQSLPDLGILANSARLLRQRG